MTYVSVGPSGPMAGSYSPPAVGCIRVSNADGLVTRQTDRRRMSCSVKAPNDTVSICSKKGVQKERERNKKGGEKKTAQKDMVQCSGEWIHHGSVNSIGAELSGT